MKNFISTSQLKKREANIDTKIISAFLENEIKMLTKLNNDFVKKYSKLMTAENIQDVESYAGIKKKLCGKIYLLANSYKDCDLDIDVEASKSAIESIFALQEFLNFYQSQLTAIKAGTKVNEAIIRQANAEHSTLQMLHRLADHNLQKKTVFKPLFFSTPSNSQLETIFESDETTTSQEIPSTRNNETAFDILNSSSRHFFSNSNQLNQNNPFDTAEFYNAPIEAIEQKYNIRTDRIESRYSFISSSN